MPWQCKVMQDKFGPLCAPSFPESSDSSSKHTPVTKKHKPSHNWVWPSNPPKHQIFLHKLLSQKVSREVVGCLQLEKSSTWRENPSIEMIMSPGVHSGERMCPEGHPDMHHMKEMWECRIQLPQTLAHMSFHWLRAMASCRDPPTPGERI